MDKRKALFRTKLRESQREKRIDSPFVKYNENNQPVCRACNVVIKSDSLWPAHQISKKHREVIENLKATAASRSNENKGNIKPPIESGKARLSSALPSDFFEDQSRKRQKIGVAMGNEGNTVSHIETNEKSSSSVTDAKCVKGALPDNFFDVPEQTENDHDGQLIRHPGNNSAQELKQLKKPLPNKFFPGTENNDDQNLSSQVSTGTSHTETKLVKGELPEGFFDNKDADLRARGVKPIKVDVNDAVKEFEKEIQVNLEDVDDRWEEEQVDAANEVERFTALELEASRGATEEIKKKLMEVKAKRLSRAQQQQPAFMGKESSDESSSGDDDDDDDTFALDWRAQRL